MLPEQVAGHQVMWAEDNLKNYPYLLLNPITGADGSQQAAGPVGYTKSPQIPPAMAALLQVTEADIADILGNQQNGDKIVSNISGKAVEMVQQRLDMQAFLYMNNHSKGVQRGGEIWLSMARDIYVESRRRMKGIGVQSEVESIEIMRPALDRNGEVVMENDLSQAKFDVVATLGPSSSSQRSATVRSLLGMLQLTQDPQTQQVLLAMAFQNMEGEGISDVRAYFRKQMVQLGVMEPTPEEAEQMAAAAQNAPPDPNAVFVEAAAEKALTEAKTLETLAKVGGEGGGAMQPQPEPAAPQIDPFEAAKRELELENMRMDNAAKFAALAKALKQQQAEEESGSEEESIDDESDDKVSEILDELKSMVESLARQVADMRPQQPIIVSTGGGGKKIQITKTSTGFSGEVVNED
jgi:hypothetical protein